nr:integrase, catalytic region, zinc finger, CCHC-type, peptidase aspartic, catalytic [Tanacetum cinerariifolium]
MEGSQCNEFKKDKGKFIMVLIIRVMLLVLGETIIHKQAIGYQNPFYLKKAQRIKPTLYDGIVISNKHVAMHVIDDEETLLLEEDFGKCFVPQQELSADEAFWYHMLNPSTKSSDPLPVKIESPKELLRLSRLFSSIWTPDVSNFMGTVRFGNNHIARIKRYGDYQLENVTISRVYDIEGLGRKSNKSSHQPKAEDTNPEKLYLLHMDLCGPIRVTSINGKRDDWDHLFQPMFDEYFTPPSIDVSSVQETTAPRAVVLADSPVSTLIDQDAPTAQEQEHSPNIS